MNKNTVSKSIFVIAIIEMVCAFIVGIVLSYGTDSFGGHTFNFEIALIYWIAGIISGMLLIGFSEVIRLLDNINNKLGGSNLFDLQPKTIEESGLINKETNLKMRDDYTREIPKSNKSIIAKYLTGKGITFKDIYYTPFDKYIVVLDNDGFHVLKISGSKPTLITKEDMSEEMKNWYESEYGK